MVEILLWEEGVEYIQKNLDFFVLYSRFYKNVRKQENGSWACHHNQIFYLCDSFLFTSLFSLSKSIRLPLNMMGSCLIVLTLIVWLVIKLSLQLQEKNKTEHSKIFDSHEENEKKISLSDSVLVMSFLYKTLISML